MEEGKGRGAVVEGRCRVEGGMGREWGKAGVRIGRGWGKTGVGRGGERWRWDWENVGGDGVGVWSFVFL